MPTHDPRTHIVTLTEDGRRAIDGIRALGLDADEEAQRLRQAEMLAQANVPDKAVRVLAAITARGFVTKSDVRALTASVRP